jgi:hypothetical protein
MLWRARESAMLQPRIRREFRQSIVIAGRTLDVTGRIHGASIGTGGSGIPGRLSKVNEIFIKSAPIAASSRQSGVHCLPL